jgi:hypothetical protein
VYPASRKTLTAHVAQSARVPFWALDVTVVVVDCAEAPFPLPPGYALCPCE